MGDDECPMGCGHIHFGRCLMWRCHCYGEPNPLIPPKLEAVPPAAAPQGEAPGDKP